MSCCYVRTRHQGWKSCWRILPKWRGTFRTREKKNKPQTNVVIRDPFCVFVGFMNQLPKNPWEICGFPGFFSISPSCGNPWWELQLRVSALKGGLEAAETVDPWTLGDGGFDHGNFLHVFVALLIKYLDGLCRYIMIHQCKS